jgi:hypothetical protein
MKKILLIIILFLPTFLGTAVAQYDPIDSLNTALAIARGAIQKSDSGLTYVTPSDLAAIEVSVEGDTSRYTVAEMDSLLDKIANGDTIGYTAAEVDSLLGLIIKKG